jgi:hypothetical protein
MNDMNGNGPWKLKHPDWPNIPDLIIEPTYGEEVRFEKGEATVTTKEARDYLLNMGPYVLVEEEEIKEEKKEVKRQPVTEEPKKKVERTPVT